MENFLGTLKYLVDQFGLIDFLDILFVSILIYYVVKFIRDRRASKLAIGVFLVLFILLFSEILGMRAMDFILSNIVQVGLIALIIVFQPELRSALEKVGGSSFKTLKNIFGRNIGRKDIFTTSIHFDWVMFVICRTRKQKDLSHIRCGGLSVIT